MIDTGGSSSGAVTITPDQQSDSGLLLFRAADRYRIVACKAAGPFIDDMHAIAHMDGWLAVHDPVSHLFGHAIELFLKSYLKAHGMSDSELSNRSLGHNLAALLLKAKQEGISVDDDASEDIDAINEYFGVTPYRWRYPRVGKADVFFARRLSEVCLDLRRVIFPAVFRRARSLASSD